MKKSYLLTVSLLLSVLFACAQNWVRDMRDPRINFFTVQNEFNDWWAANSRQILSDTGKEEGEKGELWKNYRRWERDMMPRMVATNGVRLGAFDQQEQNFYDQRRHNQAQRSAANWTYIGAPVSFNDGVGDSSAGRVNCVRFDPLNHNIIYCGAPSGGLWKSVDFGKSWQLLNTDNLSQIGVSDIAINPQNPNTLFIATGDYANAACISIGVLKSVDGGGTWDTTGLHWTISQGLLIARLLMDPLDSNIMLAATNTGVYKTIDGAHTWSKVNGAHGLNGMEFNPLNPATVYTWGTQLYKSIDTGNTWHKLTVGLPDSAASNGFGVALTPVDTLCVYVVAGDTSSRGLAYLPYRGVYRSLDGGATFTTRSTNPDGSGGGTQGLYDMNIAVSPVDKNVLNVAAVNSVFSRDGGVTWTQPDSPSHVDHHDLRFFNGSADTIFSADDGGLFISTDTGNNWRGLNNGMHIGQVYNISSGARTKYLFLTGRQDNGTLMEDTTSERLMAGGDGQQCIIDPLNENHLFGAIENGLIGTSHDGGVTIQILVYDFEVGVNGAGAWNTPYAYIQQPDSAPALYVAKDYIYKSVNGGSSFTALHSPALHGSDNLYQHMAISPSNPNYIYASTYYQLYRSTNGGATFTNITNGLNGTFTALAVSPDNPQEIWIGFSSSTHCEILHSTNAGGQFINFNTGLPGGGPFYALSIAPVKDSKAAVYCSLASAGGVYYRDSTLANWVSFSNGLPNVSVDQLEVDYCAGTIRAATYGRDIWESTPYQALAVPPLANAAYNDNCADSVTFTDQSDFNPTSWQWYFPGGQPASSTVPNPVVRFPGGGTYTVTLIAANANGADTTQYNLQPLVCTGVSQLSDNNNVNVYPNPNNGHFTISLSGQGRGKVNIALADEMGRNVYQYAYNKDADAMTTACSPPALATGIYYLRITADGINSVQKLVIE